MILAVVTAASAVGALCRYGLSGIIQRRDQTGFAVGTLTVNLIGAFLIGLLAGFDNLESTASRIGVGFAGGLTTFSTWMIETVRIGVTPLRWRALLNLVIPLVAGLALVVAGYSLTN